MYQIQEEKLNKAIKLLRELHNLEEKNSKKLILEEIIYILTNKFIEGENNG